MLKSIMLKAGSAVLVVTGMSLGAPAVASIKTPAPATANVADYSMSSGTEEAQYRKYKRKRSYYSNRQAYYNNGYNNGYYQNRNYYRCDKGNGGLAIGAVVGGLAGNELAGRGDKTLGTIIGGAVGAVAGRAIDRSNDPCRR